VTQRSYNWRLPTISQHLLPTRAPYSHADHPDAECSIKKKKKKQNQKQKNNKKLSYNSLIRIDPFLAASVTTLLLLQQQQQERRLTDSSLAS
jgi:hypothetical protein